jgi:hypothetical protein
MLEIRIRLPQIAFDISLSIIPPATSKPKRCKPKWIQSPQDPLRVQPCIHLAGKNPEQPMIAGWNPSSIIPAVRIIRHDYVVAAELGE